MGIIKKLKGIKAKIKWKIARRKVKERKILSMEKAEKMFNKYFNRIYFYDQLAAKKEKKQKELRMALQELREMKRAVNVLLRKASDEYNPEILWFLNRTLQYTVGRIREFTQELKSAK